MADGVWKGVYPYVLGRSRQLSLNKFFDTSTPSMRKIDNGKKEKKKKMSFLVATNIVASRLPEHRLTGAPHDRAKNSNRNNNVNSKKNHKQQQYQH